MPKAKNTKSSASAATRKKQAQKAAKRAGGAADGEAGSATALSSGATAPAKQPVQRGQKKDKKSKKNEPKKKVYIPPTKPQQAVQDPLDSLGLATLLPSDLVVLLRKASKKDVVTRTRALEGLADWIKDAALSQEERDSALIIALPSWAHLFPRLSASPNRRLRLLTAQIHQELLDNAAICAELLAQPQLVESILAPTLIMAFDPDRIVSRLSRATVDRHVRLEASGEEEQESVTTVALEDYLDSIVSLVGDHLLHPHSVLGPWASTAASSSSTSAVVNGVASGTQTPTSENGNAMLRDAKNRDDVNVEEDSEGTDARLVFSSLGVLGYLIGELASSPYALLLGL